MWTKGEFLNTHDYNMHMACQHQQKAYWYTQLADNYPSWSGYRYTALHAASEHYRAARVYMGVEQFINRLDACDA